MTMHSKAQVWSLLGTAPVMFYVDAADAYGVAWNGVFMGRKQAMQLAAFVGFGIAPSPRAKQFSRIEFLKLYMSGGFGEQQWGVHPDNWYFLYNTFTACRITGKPIIEHTTITAEKIVEWFSTENALRA